MIRLFAVAALVFAAAVHADEAAVRRLISERLPGAPIQSVTETRWGMYEVVISDPNEGPAILYVDPAATVVMQGNVFDGKTGHNLTQERMRKLTAVDWSDLPLKWAIPMVRGNGKRKIAILSDPNCPYCRRMEAGLAKVDNVTVYILPYAVIRPESVPEAKSVWCSKDRAKAWNELVFHGVQPTAAPTCDTPVEALRAFGERIHATATPTWFLPNNERYDGMMPIEKVVELMDRASP